jgi:predicted acylesterase/phospholipase RssA
MRFTAGTERPATPEDTRRGFPSGPLESRGGNELMQWIRQIGRFAELFLILSLLLALTGCPYHRKCPACPDPTLTAPAPLLTCGSDAETIDSMLFEPTGPGFPNANSDTDAPEVLFLSGGGSWGAWGAGVLYGWAENTANPRPKFEIVTGSSTGALLGVFAILGGPTLGPMDQKMKDVYTTSTNADIFKRRSVFAIPFSNSINTLAPLRALVKATFPPSVIDEVGAIYENEGRQLWVGTTNLDTGQFCRWNLSAIAAKKKYDQFIDLLIASCANPVVFNPVMIDGAMHADGGVRNQIYPEIVDELVTSYSAARSGRPSTPDAPTAYAVVNGQLAVRRQCIDDHILPIALRSSQILMTDALNGDLWETQGRFNPPPPSPTPNPQWKLLVSRVPEEYPLWPDPDVFDPAQMSELFDLGREAGKDFTHWHTGVPTPGPSPTKCIPPMLPGP